MDEDLLTLQDLLLKNSINYLYGISERVPNMSPTLKSFYSSKSRILQLRGNMHMPLNKNKMQTHCPCCCIKLTDGPSTRRILPEKKSRFTEKIIRKNKARKPLTKYQMIYQQKQKMKGINCNAIEETCKFCQKKVAYPIAKPPRVNSTITEGAKEPKRKRRRKDRLCGLNQSVISLVPSSAEFKTSEFIPLNSSGPNGSVRQKETIKSVNKQHQKPLDKTIGQPKYTSVQNKRTKIKQMKENKKNAKKLKNLLGSSNKNKTTSKLKHFLSSL